MKDREISDMGLRQGPEMIGTGFNTTIKSFLLNFPSDKISTVRSSPVAVKILQEANTEAELEKIYVEIYVEKGLARGRASRSKRGGSSGNSTLMTLVKGEREGRKIW